MRLHTFSQHPNGMSEDTQSAAERKSLQSQFYYLVTSQWPTTKVLIFNNLSALEFQGNEDLIG